MSKKKATGTSTAKGTTDRSRREELQARRQAEAARRKRTTIIGAIICGVLAIAIIAVIAVVVVQDQKTKREQREREANSQIVPPNAVDESGIWANPETSKDAKYTLNIYMDYQCPHCRTTDQLYAATWKKLGDEGFVKIYLHTMTFMDNNYGNDSSKKVAVAAACADTTGQGNYWKFNTNAFALKPESEGAVGYPNDLVMKQIPEASGITGPALQKYTTCVNDNATAEFTRKVNENAGKAGVNSTPTVKVNGDKNPVVGKNQQGQDVYWWSELEPDVDAWKKAIESAAAS